jgi:phospholipid/cholesterol/gamma-HCH transport system permease protein
MMGVNASGRAGAPSAYFQTWRRIRGSFQELARTTGQWAVFIGQVIYLLPLTVRKYRREALNRMNDLAWGRGSLIIDGGVISVLVILGIAIGGMVGIEAWATLNIMGLGALTGIIGSLANVREMGPLVAGIAFATQCGCRMTAEIGSMRIAEEIDATEAMGLRPIPFVVGTRFIGGLLCVIPGYALTLLTSFFVVNFMIRGVYHADEGTYQHYFLQFLSPLDLVYSTLKATVFCAAVIIIHCYYGYFASGGPVGVGQASGRAVRASLVVVMALDFFMTVSLWGLRPTFIFTG